MVRWNAKLWTDVKPEVLRRQEQRFLRRTRAGLDRSRFTPHERRELRDLCGAGLADALPVQAPSNRLWTHLAREYARRDARSRWTSLDSEQVAQMIDTGDWPGDAAVIRNITAKLRAENPTWSAFADEWILLEPHEGHPLSHIIATYLRAMSSYFPSAVTPQKEQLIRSCVVFADVLEKRNATLLIPPFSWIESAYEYFLGPIHFRTYASIASRQCFAMDHARGEQSVTLSLVDLPIADRKDFTPLPGIFYAAHDVGAHAASVARHDLDGRRVMGMEFQIANHPRGPLRAWQDRDFAIERCLDRLASMEASERGFSYAHAAALHFMLQSVLSGHRSSDESILYRDSAHHMLAGLDYLRASAPLSLPERARVDYAIAAWQKIALHADVKLGVRPAFPLADDERLAVALAV